ncbi:EFC14 protein, partial [Columbina picui]|nr:EFC14 protein [Columbina picui]
MKKRKELNALIGLAADGRRKKSLKNGSGHRLLRTEPPASDSESSSEEDEFAAAGARGRCGKGDYLRCCKFCYPLCAFVILAACVVACVGLVWMQVALKEDLDAIKDKFRTMESNQKTSFQEIPKLNEDLVQKQKQLEQIETGELGLNKIWINITEINKQISLLTSTVNHLKNNIKSAPDLISLPLTVEKLQKASTVNVAFVKHVLVLLCALAENSLPKNCPVYFGKKNGLLKLPWLFHGITMLIARLLRRLSKPTCSHFIFQESQSLHTALKELNNTVLMYQKLNDIKLLNVDSAIGNLSQKVMLLENSTLAVNNLDKRENLSIRVLYKWVVVFVFVFLHMQETGTRDSQVLKRKETLQLISALTGMPENDRPTETSKNVESSPSTTAKPTDLSRLASRSADDNAESNGQLRHLSLPGISSIEDLQNLFQEATEDADRKLSHGDLQKLLGSTAQESQSFKKFDTDGDEKYSLQELRLALGV